MYVLSEQVVTRWYRAPEVVLLASEYTTSIDIWAVGCILAELVLRKPLFTGKDHLDQIKRIIEMIGTPSQEDLKWLPTSGPARRFVGKCPQSNGKLDEVFKGKTSNEQCIELIHKMLVFNPSIRYHVDQCLEHVFFQELHVDDPECNSTVSITVPF